MNAYRQYLCITDTKMKQFQELPLTQSSRITPMYQNESWICIHISSCSILFTVDCVIQAIDERCIKSNQFFFSHRCLFLISLSLVQNDN